MTVESLTQLIYEAVATFDEAGPSETDPDRIDLIRELEDSNNKLVVTPYIGDELLITVQRYEGKDKYYE